MLLLVDASSDTELANGIVKVLQDKSLQISLRKKGYKNISRFNWKNSALQHRQIFEQMVNK